MSAWSEGYFTDVQYTRKFFPHLAPSLLAFACLRQGIRPPTLGPGSTYLELGCGQGFGLNLLAAANPTMQFWGIDFHPGQISNAQRLARSAGLTNITFEDFSFAQMLDLPDGRIPRCDVITLHGIYSWVSPENRANLVRILDRHLKPGGMVMISYNTLPGWNQILPLRRFAKASFDRTSGPPRTRAVEAFRLVKELIASGARGFGSSGQVHFQIEEALKGDPAYLIGEYMNEYNNPLYHADVARELDGARLTFAASVNMADDLIGLAAPEKLQATILAESDPIWRETLLDHANSRLFRTDVFVRGPNVLTPAEREALLAPMRFHLLRPPGQVQYEFKIPIGSMKGDPAIYGAVVEALAGSRTYGELSRLPPIASGPDGLLMKVLGLLIGAGVTHPPAMDEAVDFDQPQRFNRACLENLTFENPPPHLAAPAIGTGVVVSLTDVLALTAQGEKNPDFQAQARRSWELMLPTRTRFTKNGAAITDQAAHEAEATVRMKAFHTQKLPLLRRLGVV